MKTAFRCEQCQTRLVAKATLAGRTSRCPKCGHQVVVPAAGTTTAGDWRAAVSQQLDPQKPLTSPSRATAGESEPEPDSGYRLKSLTPVGTPKLKATSKPTQKRTSRSSSSVAPSQPEAQQPGGRAASTARQQDATPTPATKAAAAKPTPLQDEDDERVGLFGDMDEVAFEFNPPEPVVAPSQVRSGLSDVLRVYRSVFSLLARGTKGISEASYTISFILLIQALAGGIMGRHGLASLALGLIVLLNVIGFVGDLASLVMLSFRKDPMQGLLFLLPPYAVYYLWTDWKRYQEVVGRMRIPLLMLGLVALAYAFVPWLSVDEQQASSGEVAIAESAEGEPPPSQPPSGDASVGYGVGLVETAADWVWSLMGGEPKQLFHSQDPPSDAESPSEE